MNVPGTIKVPGTFPDRIARARDADPGSRSKEEKRNVLIIYHQ